MLCDNFALDLLPVIPELAEILAPVRDLRLATHGHVTDGKLKHATRRADR